MVVVQDPTTLVVEQPAAITYVSEATDDSGAEQATQPVATEEGPLVEFGRLADQRLRELQAYEIGGQQSQEGIAQGDDGKFYKAYYRFPLRAIRISVANLAPLELEGEIQYDHVLVVQSAESKEALVGQQGRPREGDQPVRATEKYRYQNGDWSFVEKE
ncbi:hypothetical protein AMJ85_11685 [candidate division BRC1 bacterium SM23_51]|nr:MAG: hypothetical protein AMJ85_11685 [candidate division BRC1 bacterium SM23_51]